MIADLAYDGSNTNGYRGDCRLAVDGTAVGTTISYGQAAYVASGGVTVVGGPGFNANGQEGGGLNVVTAALPTGTHSFALQCNQGGGSIEFSETSVSAAMLGPASNPSRTLWQRSGPASVGSLRCVPLEARTGPGGGRISLADRGGGSAPRSD